MLLRLAIPLTVIVATSAYAMRPLPDHITSTNIIDMRGEYPKPATRQIGQINWRFPAKLPGSVNAKYGPPDVPWPGLPLSGDFGRHGCNVLDGERCPYGVVSRLSAAN